MKKKLAWSGLSLMGGVGILFASPTPAEAHVCMDFPLSRVGAECVARSPQKMGPCPLPRTEHVNVFRPGETIRVRLRETVNHPSHYRIAFDPDGQDFRDPVSVEDTQNDYPHILVDGIADAEEAIQEVEITFPNVETENGTLQLIQVMYDKGRNGFGGASGGPNDNDDMYYSCADIALRAGPVAVAAGEEITTKRNRRAFPVAAVLLAIGIIGAAGTRKRE